MRCVLVKLKYWEIMIKLLDDICEIAVQLSVHTLYRYGGNCRMCHDENMYGYHTIVKRVACYIRHCVVIKFSFQFCRIRI
jgi:hypothetical protein